MTDEELKARGWTCLLSGQDYTSWYHNAMDNCGPLDNSGIEQIEAYKDAAVAEARRETFEEAAILSECGPANKDDLCWQLHPDGDNIAAALRRLKGMIL